MEFSLNINVHPGCETVTIYTEPKGMTKKEYNKRIVAYLKCSNYYVVFKVSGHLWSEHISKNELDKKRKKNFLFPVRRYVCANFTWMEKIQLKKQISQ